MAGSFVNFNGTSILQLMSFFILMYFLIKFLYRPFLNMIDKRSEEIKAKYEKADEAHKEAEELREKAKIELKELNERINQMYEEAKVRVNEYEKKEKARVQSEVESIMKRARNEIEEERTRAEETLRANVITLAVALASRIIQKDLDEKSKREFLMDQLSKVRDRR